MKPIVTFRTGAAMAADYICLAGAIDGFDVNEQYTRVFAYDEKDSSLGFYYEEECKIVAIRTWMEPTKKIEIFITMSDEGEIAFVGEDPVVENSDWNQLKLPSTERLTAIFLDRNGELWMCGANGTLIHGDSVRGSIGFKDIARFDGSSWTRIDHPANPPIR